jgi:hypothetical protein
MDNDLDRDKKKRWFLWGLAFAWIPLLPMMIGIVNAFKGMSENKATGLTAVAGGWTEGYVTFGLMLSVLLPLAAIVLLAKSSSSLHPMRTLVSWFSICWSVLALLLSGLSVWILFSHVATAAR